MLPPIPKEWDAWHPLIVHFPIGLLLLAVPVLMILGIVLPKSWRSFQVAALVIMLLGVGAAWVAVSTGKAAAGLTEQIPTLKHHKELAETSAWSFSILSAIYAVMTIGPSFFKKPLKRWITVSASVVFLLVYLGFATVLARTAHLGGLLVHEYGIHAMLPLGDEK